MQKTIFARFVIAMGLLVLAWSPGNSGQSRAADAVVSTRDERFIVRVQQAHIHENAPDGFDSCACDSDGAMMFLTQSEIDALKVPFTVHGTLRDYARPFRPDKTMAEVGAPSIARLLGEPIVHAQPLGGTAGALTLDYDRYHTPAEGVLFYQSLAAAYPQIAQAVVLGSSVEARDIWALKISDNPEVNEPEEQAIFFCGVHHAREWATHEMMLYLAEYLVTRYDTDPRVRNIIDNSVVWLVLTVNPDGFEYSWTVDRFWRKNRRFNGNDGNQNPIYGVDINRNYDYRWGPGYGNGSSPLPWAEAYRGTAAASEPETQAIQALLTSAKPAIAVSFHTYSQLLLYSWGYTAPVPAQSYPSLRAIADTYVSKVRQVHGMTYTPGPINYALYPTNGDFTDYAYGAQGAMSFTPELRPNSANLGGFLLPENQILPNNQENLASALWLMDTVAGVQTMHAPLAETFTEGFNLFSLPHALVNQKPEAALGMTSEVAGHLAAWIDDQLHPFASGFYLYPGTIEGIGGGSAYRFEYNQTTAPWADAFTEYSALPFVYDNGAVMKIKNVEARAPNYVGVPSDQPVRMRDIKIVKRIMQPVGTTFGWKEVFLETRTALEDMNAAEPWISWEWEYEMADGAILTSHPIGLNGADEFLQPYRAYRFTSFVPSYAFYDDVPVYLLVFPPPMRADATGDGVVDLADYAAFHACINGPVPAELSQSCALSDLDHDFDVDSGDFAIFQQQFGLNNN